MQSTLYFHFMSQIQSLGWQTYDVNREFWNTKMKEDYRDLPRTKCGDVKAEEKEEQLKRNKSEINP